MADYPLVGAVADMFRSPQELALENAYLRQQVVVLQRSVKQPTPDDPRSHGADGGRGVRAPDMNAVMERFLQSVRAEALDHLLITDDRHPIRWYGRTLTSSTGPGLTKGSSSASPEARSRLSDRRERSSAHQCSAAFTMTTAGPLDIG
jgi:hypothetical protein